MQCVTMLVTPQGEWVFENSPEFRAALGDPDPDPDYDATLFAVKNLGFIKFEMLGRSVIEIELHPHNVALPALLAVQEQLQSSRIPLFRIRHFDTAWRSEIFPAAERVMERLSELCAPSFALPSSKKFIVEPKDYFALIAGGASMLRLLVQKWRMSFGHFDSTVLSFAIKHGLLGRMVIAGVGPPNMDPVFRFIGHGFQWMDSEFPFYGVGEKIENLPDREYGSWVAEFYKYVAAVNEPRYDIVTAAIRANPQQSSPYMTRYERLLLPWKTPSREIFVTLLSERLADRKAAASAPAETENLASIALKSS